MTTVGKPTTSNVTIRRGYESSPRIQTTIVGASRAKQSFKDECNINNILAKYNKTGIVTHISDRVPHYQNLPGETSYHDMMNTVVEAQEAFQSLDAKVRQRFHNDPAEMLKFVSDPANADELIELGLAQPTAEQKTDPSGTPPLADPTPAPPAPEKAPSDGQ